MIFLLSSRRDTTFYTSLLERIFCMVRIRIQKYFSLPTENKQIFLLVIPFCFKGNFIFFWPCLVLVGSY